MARAAAPAVPAAATPAAAPAGTARPAWPAPGTRRRASRGVRPSPAGGDEAVSDTLGSILMVGITVVVAVTLGLLLLGFEGPAPRLYADLAIQVDPGAGGWGTGDETVRVLHRGGDPLPEQTAVAVRVDGVATSYTGAAALGSTWGDGVLSIGEIWQKAATIPEGAAVSVAIVEVGPDHTAILSSGDFLAAALGAAQPCATDTAFPTVLLWRQSPPTITALHSGPVTVTAQLGDGCWGVNPDVAPSFLWRITPDAPYTDQGPMAPAGLHQWTATIPARAWSAHVGQSLQYHMTPVADLGGNTGRTPDISAAILADCRTDNVPPTAASLTHVPADVRTSTVGPVNVTVVVQDACAGVDTATNPTLHYRFNAGNDPAFTSAGTMARVSGTTWRGTIPAQAWAAHAGRTMQYFVGGMRDANGNLGATAVNSDVVEVFASYTYVASNTPTAGTVTGFQNARSDADSGAEATLAEAGTAGTPVTASFNANAVVNANGWTSGPNAFASDNSYASFASNGPAASNDLQVALQDPVVTAGAITSVVLNAEVSITSFNNDGFRLYACLAGGACNAVSPIGGQSASDVTLAYDITALRPGGGAWSWNDVLNLQGLVRLEQGGSRDGTWRVDRVWVEVTAISSAYSTDVRFDWTGVPTGGTHTLEIRYRTVGEAWTVQVWNGVQYAARWTALSSSTGQTWAYALTAAEYNLGAPRIRIVDNSPTGTTQGSLYIDYMRVATI